MLIRYKHPHLDLLTGAEGEAYREVMRGGGIATTGQVGNDDDDGVVVEITDSDGDDNHDVVLVGGDASGSGAAAEAKSPRKTKSEGKAKAGAVGAVVATVTAVDTAVGPPPDPRVLEFVRLICDEKMQQATMDTHNIDIVRTCHDICPLSHYYADKVLSLAFVRRSCLLVRSSRSSCCARSAY